MADLLLQPSAALALVVSSAEKEQAVAISTKEEGALALVEDGKRKSKWPGQSIKKKGRRWGLAEDKPYRPLPYVDLPVGLSEMEVDQFLREQRLEDLHRRIQLHQLEDVDPDIRTPSPPPIYDKAGNRLNTREVRIRKTMLAEYNRLIRYMIKTLEGYTPPLDWRPQKLIKKVIIPYEKYPQAPFMGVIIGARGVNHKRLQEVTGCKVFIRGKDIGDKWQNDEEGQMPQHVHIEADTEEQIEAAEKLIMPLLNPESAEFEYARTCGMQQLAQVNGFNLKKTEQRCGICSAVGHLGFECPEIGGVSYKMANVVCEICGDKGHVASDCKVTAEKHQRENVDWKAEAEKRREMDSEYKQMMSELGIEVPTTPLEPEVPMSTGQFRPPVAHAAPRQAPKAPLLRPPIPPVARLARPGGPLLALPAPQGGAVAAGNASAVTVVLPRQVRPAVAPRPPVRATLRPHVVPATHQPQLLARPSPRPPPPPHRPRPGLGWTTPQAAPTPSSTSTSQPLPESAPEALGETDVSIGCPADLVDMVLSPGNGVLAELSQETGARVDLTDSFGAGGGRRFLIAGHPQARERAKLHLRAWLDVQKSAKSNGSGGLVPPPTSFSAPLPGFLPAGFPPLMGFPPGMGPTPSEGCGPDGSLHIPEVAPGNASPSGGFPPGFPPTFGAGASGGPPDVAALAPTSGFLGPPVLNDDPEI